MADENLITFLKGREPGMNIETAFTDGRKTYKIRVRGLSGINDCNSPSEYRPLVLIDGVPTTFDILEIMNATQIDRI